MRIGTEILNLSASAEDFDPANDHEVDKIQYYTVNTLRLEKCPYGSDYKEACFIYMDELSCVHPFYDENAKEEEDKP